MKIFNLTYNELVKQFKKPSIKIMLALILISAIVLPIGISKLPAEPYLNNAKEGNQFLLEQAIQNLDQYKDDKTQKGKILYKYAQIDKDQRQMMVDYSVGFEDWRENETGRYANVLYDLAAVEFIQQGFNQETVFKNLQSIDPQKVESYYKMNKTKLQEVKTALEADRDRLFKIIDTSDYLGHIKEEIKEKEYYIGENQKEIDAYNKLKAKNPTSNEKKEELKKLAQDAKIAEESIEDRKEEIQILQFRLDNKIDYKPTNWKNNSIKTVEKEVQELRMNMLTEEQYAMESSRESYTMTYDEYVENFKKLTNKRIDKINRIWYGLENNIPDLDDITDARSTVDGTYELYIVLAVIMVIVLAGGIVSTEFSKGTIRLLLIRPVSRWKVLFSKLLSVLLVGFSIVVLGIGILYVTSGAVYGFETYNTPILDVVNGVVVQQSFLSILLPKIAISSASLVFITSLVFTLSTVTKNTALSVAISMLVYLGAAPIATMLISFKQTWLVNTLVPYINGSYFRIIPTIPNMLETASGMQMNYSLGAMQLLVASLILLIVAFITFTKKDVKN